MNLHLEVLTEGSLLRSYILGSEIWRKAFPPAQIQDSANNCEVTTQVNTGLGALKQFPSWFL